MQLCKVNGQYEIWLPEHRASRPQWYTELGWEKIRMEEMLKRISDGDIVYYVGAEEGDLAALCAMKGGVMVLIEPNPIAWPNIRAIWEANKLRHPLFCFTGFAGDVTNENPNNLNFEVGNKDGWPICAYGEIVPDHGFRELNTQADCTPQMRIDDISDVRPPKIISIDVEGSEVFVLEGAKETLKKYKPIIFLSGHPEFMANQYGQYLGDLRQWIKDFGYEETLLEYSHEVHLMYLPI